MGFAAILKGSPNTLAAVCVPGEALRADSPQLLSPSPTLSHTPVLCPHGNSLCWLPGSDELPLVSSTKSLHLLPTTHCLCPALVSPIYCHVPEPDSHLCPLGSHEHTHW